MKSRRSPFSGGARPPQSDFRIPHTAIADAIKAWWDQPRGLRIQFLTEHGPAFEGASYQVAWPRLMMCLEGERSYAADMSGRGGSRMRAGQGIFFSPGTWISPLPGPYFVSLGIHWEPDGVKFILREGNALEPPKAILHGPQTPGSEKRFAEKIAAALSQPSGRHLAEGLLLTEIGRIVNSLQNGRPRGAERRGMQFLKICAFLEEHYAENLTRECVSQVFGISPGHLTRIFRCEGQAGFNGTLNGLRLEAARHLLHSTSLTIQEVALRCGFTDAAYFSRSYRKRFGLPPSGRSLKE